jgi:transcription antitermination factor NusG
MPLLAAETSVFPDSLFDSDENPFALDSRWWVLHTRPRQEKALARQLLEQQIQFYLPVITLRRRQGGRCLTSHVPLFPSYVFLLASPEQRVTALTTNRVANTLLVGEQAALHRDLGQIYKLIASGAAITPEQRLAPGDLVEIKSGPLAGLKGKILRTATGRRFVVEVDFIQRGASVLLEDHCLAASVS